MSCSGRGQRRPWSLAAELSASRPREEGGATRRIGTLKVNRLLVALLAVVWPANAFAGPPQTRKGFWLSFGFGYGSARVECDQCIAGGREGSLAAWLRVGGTISDHFLLGWELNGWLKNDKARLQTSGDLTRTLGNSAVIAAFYPRAASGFFVKVGAGLSYAGLPPRPTRICPSLDLVCLGALDEGAHGNGFGMTAGVGYDFRIRANLSITPDLTFTRGSPGDLRVNGQPTVVTGWQHDILAFGVGVTFH
jgi:hypothetical protein